VPTAQAPIPQPMSATKTASVVPPQGDDKNPMAAASDPLPTTGGGGGEATPPANRAKTFLPETDPPGKNPDDTFPLFEPTSRS
jgi:hypothetical protein